MPLLFAPDNFIDHIFLLLYRPKPTMIMLFNFFILEIDFKKMNIK